MGLFQPLGLNKSLLGTETSLVVASVLNGEPENNCRSVLYSKGNFLRDGEKPLPDTKAQFPQLCKANDRIIVESQKGHFVPPAHFAEEQAEAQRRRVLA